METGRENESLALRDLSQSTAISTHPNHCYEGYCWRQCANHKPAESNHSTKVSIRPPAYMVQCNCQAHRFNGLCRSRIHYSVFVPQRGSAIPAKSDLEAMELSKIPAIHQCPRTPSARGENQVHQSARPSSR